MEGQTEFAVVKLPVSSKRAQEKKESADGAECSSRQYIVKKGDILDVDLLPDEFCEGTFKFDVLLHSDGKKVSVGTPLVSTCTVIGKYVDDTAGEKLNFIKYTKRKTSTRTRYGHRQHYSRVEIQEIKG